jgi:hypothetical protein
MVLCVVNDSAMPYTANCTLEEYCVANFEIGKDGFLYRKMSKGRPCNPRLCGGWLLKGYRQITLKFATKVIDVSLHRLTYFVRHNQWPKMVDHRDCNPLNNHIDNLRAADDGENARNHGNFKTNKHKLPVGVCRRGFDGKFLACVQIDGKTKVKAFWDVDEAIEFRKKWAAQIYGEFAPVIPASR